MTTNSQNSQQQKSRFKNFSKGMIKSLQNVISPLKQTDDDGLKKVKNYLIQLFQKYQQNTLNYDKFIKQRELHYIIRTIKLSGEKIESVLQKEQIKMSQNYLCIFVLSEQDNKKNKDKWNKWNNLRYNNYRQMTIYFSENKQKFKHISKHNFIEQSTKTQDVYFKFQNERGIQYCRTINNEAVTFEDKLFWGQVKNPIIFYIFVRDLASAIMQLQLHKICDLDIKPENTILICKRLDYFNDNKQLRTIIGQIIFKLIDFEDTFYIRHRKIKTKLQKLQEYSHDLFFDYPSDFSQKKNDWPGKNHHPFDYDKDKQPMYKKYHSDQFISAVQQFYKKIKGQIKEETIQIKQIEKQIKNKNYGQLIIKMQAKINKILQIQ